MFKWICSKNLCPFWNVPGRINAVFDVYYTGYRPITRIDRDIKRHGVSADYFCLEFIYCLVCSAIFSNELVLKAADMCLVCLHFPPNKSLLMYVLLFVFTSTLSCFAFFRYSHCSRSTTHAISIERKILWL